jgi:hypothetical protein
MTMLELHMTVDSDGKRAIVVFDVFDAKGKRLCTTSNACDADHFARLWGGYGSKVVSRIETL